MSLSAETLRMMDSMGLTIAQAADLAAQIERDFGPSASSGAGRQRRYRERVKARDVTDDVTRDVTSVTPPLSPPPPKETIKPPTTPIRDGDRQRASSAKPAFIAPSDIPEAEWEAYDEMRRRIDPKAWTDAAKRTNVSKLRKLAEAGYPPGEVLAQSVERGWKGVFKLEDERHGHRNGGNVSTFPARRTVGDLAYDLGVAGMG